MRKSLNQIRLIVFAVLWAAALSVGGWRLWGYEATAGASARPSAVWPAATHLSRSSTLPTMVVVLHPQCPCSRATIDELARLMANCEGKLLATAVMVRPAGVPDGWEKTDLWRSAAAIPGVNVISDGRGEEAHRFGALTSGQVLLFSTDGHLLFTGGITESRGHSGDNAGRSAIEALVLNPAPVSDLKAVGAPVYGCSLFDKPALNREQR